VASIEKLIQKMKNQPYGITYNEAARVLTSFNYRFARQNGSHCHYINESGDVITIVRRNDAIKRVYVDAILDRIGEIK